MILSPDAALENEDTAEDQELTLISAIHIKPLSPLQQ